MTNKLRIGFAFLAVSAGLTFGAPIFSQTIDSVKNPSGLQRPVQPERVLVKEPLKTEKPAARPAEGNLEQRRQNYNQHMRNMVSRLTASADRLEKLAERIESRIDKFEEAGRKLEEARQALKDAREKIAAARLEIAEVSKVYPDILKENRPSESFAKVRELIQNAGRQVRAAHQALVRAITLIKAGAN